MKDKKKIEIKKLENKNNEIKNNIDNKFLNIGNLYYESKENDEKMQEIVKEIDSLYAQINKNNKSINKIKFIEKTCEKCGEKLNLDSKFCQHCGGKAIINNKLENMKSCTSCNALNELENKYCFNCGNGFDN